ncbi:nitroreductase family protein [Limibacter armeniacum]|uniref:nitroreductase family protein n=1 Tax=Limibacter armeniacum TaxID=466084 RepID=UPI002FE6A473
MTTDNTFIPYTPQQFSEEEMQSRVAAFRAYMDQRRSIREFSDKPIPDAIIRDIIMAASTAPSGAHKQPWTYCVVTDPEIKKQIRKAAEEEEYESYHNRMSDQWLKDLEPLGTDWHKPFLEVAPCLIIIFKRVYELDQDGKKRNNYYVNESVGLSAGMLLTAIHQAGLVSLTHTPSPMNFLQKILDRPENERPYLLIPVGYPSAGVTVPDLTRKQEDEVIVYY